MALPNHTRIVRDFNCAHCYPSGGDIICVQGDDNCTLRVKDENGKDIEGQYCLNIRPVSNNPKIVALGAPVNPRRF